MYNTEFLLNTLDSIIESAKDRLNEFELQMLVDIRNHLAGNESDDNIEKYFFDLFKWLLLIIEYLKNTS